MSTDTSRRAYTVAEVAESTGASRQAIYQAIRTGEIKGVRFAGRIVVTCDELDRLLAGGVR